MSLRGGKRCAILARVKGLEADVTPGDSVKAYLLLHNSHDGSLSVGVKFTGVRVVCNNTLQMARAEGGGFRFRHSQGMHAALETVQKAVDCVNRDFNLTIEQYRQIAGVTINRAEVEQYVRKVFQVPEEEETLPIPAARVIDLTQMQRGYELIPAARGTLWGAYNAVTEYLTHEAGRTDDSRANGLYFGAGADLGARALSVANQMAMA